jgi:hypothetical protein
MVSAMSLDTLLTQSISGLAGQSSAIDWLFLYLSNPDVLWLPGIVLGSYWLWLGFSRGAN